MDYENKSERELVELAKSDDTQAKNELCKQYKGVVYEVAKGKFLKGAHQSDLIQEGFIGLLKAIDNYDFENKTNFSSFAYLCIERSMLTAIARHDRKKHTFLNEYISLEKDQKKNVGSTKKLTLSNLIGSETHIEKECITKIVKDNLIKHMQDSLSDLEFNSIVMFTMGYDYQYIADKHSRSYKAIDNAIQRARKKLQKNIFVNELRKVV